MPILGSSCRLFPLRPLAAILALATASPCALAQQGAPASPATSPANNLVRNPSFEDGAQGFYLPSGLATVDAKVARSGRASLKFANSDPALYKWAAQEIATSGGATYAFSAWVKGENVVSTPDAEANRGAGVFLEWYDGAGAWLGGAYPEGQLGTFDWKRIEGTANLPLNARKLIVGLYLRKGSTGTAWFDDLTVVATTPPLRVLLRAPGYRGLIVRGDRAPWRADLSVARSSSPQSPLSIRSQVLDGTRVVASQTVPVPARRSGEGETVQIALAQPLPASFALLGGAPEWKITLCDARGTPLAKRTFAFRVRQRWPRVAIRPGGAWQVEGAPFYPLGIYTQGEADTSDAALAKIAGAGFNTVLNYSYGAGKDPLAFLNRAHKHGLKVIYSLKDFTPTAWEFPKEQGLSPAQQIEKHIRLVKDHPALLAWYLNDEGGLEHADEFAAMQKLVLALDDREHPVVHVLFQYGSLDGYYDLTDVLGVDPYPIPRFGFGIVPTWTRAARQAARGAKSALLVTQAFSWTAYPKPPAGSRFPTESEMRTMNLLGLCEKPNGLLFYAFMDLYLSEDGQRDFSRPDAAQFNREWPRVAAVSRELRTLLPALIDGRDVALGERNEAPSTFKVRAIEQGATIKIIVANADAQSAARITVPAARVRALRVEFGGAKISKTATRWTIELPPHGSALLSGGTQLLATP